jgi:hypothetical protein
MAHRFRVQFYRFGSGDQLPHLTTQVLRITRPHLLNYDIQGLVCAAAIEIDLRDDVLDINRVEVLTQLHQQIKDDLSFALTIETLDQNEKVLERWLLDECRISDCQFDELTTIESRGLMIHLQVDVKRVRTELRDQIVTMLGDSTTDSIAIATNYYC